MKTICHHIDSVIKFAENEGNSVCGTSASPLMDKTIWMNNPASVQLREKIQLEMPELEYKRTFEKPHDPATECFICYEDKTILIFPLSESH